MGGQKICFLIDDDVDDQEIFAMALREVNASIKCIFASDGNEAMARLKHGGALSPDFIFLDLNMPGMSGKDCLMEIRKHSHLIHIPLVIYSTSCDEDYQLELMKLGATECIVKPPRMAALMQRLNDFFRKYQE